MFRTATATLLLLSLIALPAQAQQVAEIQAAKDNTLYEDAGGNTSNGSGQQLFAGKTNTGEIRRALVAFDLTGAISDGAVVDSVQRQLTMNKSQGTQQNMHIHRVTSDWGEGSADSAGQEGGGTSAVDGDATWLHAVRPNVVWSNPGGDFVTKQSAIIPIINTGAAIWYSTTDLVEDVNHWLSNPSNNFGWLVMGDETANRSALRFASRQHADATARPLLRVFYTATATFVESSEQPTGLELESSWPNPFTSSVSLRVSSDRPESVLIEVFDLQGRRVSAARHTLLTGDQVLTLDGDSWSSGAYLVKMTSSQSVLTRTILKAR